MLNGGAISVKDAKKLISSSYDKSKVDQEGYKIDHALSGQRVKVFTNPQGKAFVVHRGTKGFRDVVTDAKLMLGMKNNNRYNHAKKIQKEAELKYGAKNITTLGHSLGGDVANTVGKKSHEIITLNKASAQPWQAKPSNQIDIRTTIDPVSLLGKLQKSNGREINIPSTSFNPLTEHSSDVLDRIENQDEVLGTGLNNKWMQHVKSVQKENGVSYKEAMKLAKKTYKK